MPRRLLLAISIIVLSTLAGAQAVPMGVRVNEGVQRTFRTKRVDPIYPPLAIQTHLEGVVVLNIWIDKTGVVQKVTIESGQPMLAESAIAAVKQWQYKPYLISGEPVLVETKVTLNYKISADSANVGLVRDAPGEPGSSAVGAIFGVISASPTTPPTTPLPHPIRISSKLAESMRIRKLPPQYPPAARNGDVKGAVLLDVIIDEDGDVYSATVISGDSTLDTAALDAVKQWKYKPYLFAGKAVDAETTVRVSFGLKEADDQENEPNIGSIRTAAPYPATTGIIGPGPEPRRIRVSSGVATGLLDKRVEPVCPMSARVKGAVQLAIRIDKDGTVVDIKLISGHPLLVAAAIDAVRQWKFKPYLLDQTPLEVETQVTVDFKC